MFVDREAQTTEAQQCGSALVRKKALVRVPLHIAAFKDDDAAATVKYLLEAGATNAVKDASGLTPADLAKKQDRHKAKDMILAHNAAGDAAVEKKNNRRRSRDSTGRATTSDQLSPVSTWKRV